ncbi:MAG: hypothetical protein IRZ31_19840 [Thermogemmatispora sp.]|nr:hypothetical protein [Thermogemmatispora sp.]
MNGRYTRSTLLRRLASSAAMLMWLMLLMLRLMLLMLLVLRLTARRWRTRRRRTAALCTLSAWLGRTFLTALCGVLTFRASAGTAARRRCLRLLVGVRG